MTKKKTPDEPQPEDVPQDEPYKPMAVPEPDPIERLAALELRMAQMEKAVTRHNQYHFSSVTHP